MWRRVGIVRTNVSEERVASIFRVEEICGRKKNVSSRITDFIVTPVKTSKTTGCNVVWKCK
jgi:hypothetical protein